MDSDKKVALTVYVPEYLKLELRTLYADAMLKDSDISWQDFCRKIIVDGATVMYSILKSKGG